MIRRDFLDKAVSDAVRASWAECAKCARSFDRQKNGTWSQNFQASHYWKRGSGSSTRWWPNNLVALCGHCHDLVGGDVEEHYKFMLGILGETLLDELRVRKWTVMKYTRAEKKEMAAHYREETKRIMSLRDQGETGYISLVAWD